MFKSRLEREVGLKADRGLSGVIEADSENYLRINRYTGSPRTTFVICRNDPVSDMSNPPNDAYAVLADGTVIPSGHTGLQILHVSSYTISAAPPSNLYTYAVGNNM